MTFDLPTFTVEWTQIDGVDVLRIAGEPLAAIPANGKRSSSGFIVFDVETRERVCQLSKKEVRRWLCGAARSRARDAADAIEERARRLEIVRDYLAVRAARRAEAARQLNLF